MSEEKKRWKWWQKASLGTTLFFLTLVAALLGLRKPWIRPLSGVRMAMAHPFVKESDLGPQSAYRLLLQAIEEPTEAKSPPGSLRVWKRDWTDALTKLKIHPWPATPPPPAPAPPEPEAMPEEEEHDGPMLAPLGNEGSGGAGDLALGLPPNHPALAPTAPWTLEQVQDIQRLVRLHEPNMALLDMALAAPDPQVPTEDSFDVSRTYLEEARTMARLLSASAQYRAATGDYAGSRRDLVRTVRMANLICRGGGLVNHLTGIACQAIAARAAWTIASRHDVLSVVLKQTASDLLASADAAEPFAEGVRAEALVVKSMLQSAFRQALLGSAGGAGAPSSAIPASRFGIFLARLADSSPEDTLTNLTAYYQHMVVFAKKPYSAAVQKEYEDFTRQLEAITVSPVLVAIRTKDPIGLILASMLGPSLKTAHSKAAQRDAVLRGAALFLAIKAYAKEHGVLPEKLGQLVPDYLPRVPEDPFDGKPFRYLRSGVPGLPPKAWAVYSIGKDFTDDGGRARSVGEAYRKRVVNPDLVWPSQAYPPEPPDEP